MNVPEGKGGKKAQQTTGGITMHQDLNGTNPCGTIWKVSTYVPSKAFGDGSF